VLPADILEAAVRKYGIENCVAIVTDNAANQKASRERFTSREGFKHIKTFRHVPCSLACCFFRAVTCHAALPASLPVLEACCMPGYRPPVPQTFPKRQ
jgi:hypothetical protein